jgi:hypothetical protein
LHELQELHGLHLQSSIYTRTLLQNSFFSGESK